MIEFLSLALSLLVAWLVLRPFFGNAPVFSDDQNSLYEKEDYARLREGLEFDLARGLISSADYERQKKRLNPESK